jgi:hypothetical protein
VGRHCHRRRFNWRAYGSRRVSSPHARTRTDITQARSSATD